MEASQKCPAQNGRSAIPPAVAQGKFSVMARVLIGTSGWHYDSWRGPFFPKGLPIKNQLQYYASQFQTAELNGVFYRTPTPEAVRSWRNQTGDDFVFAWKASKFITHWKRLSGNSVNSGCSARRTHDVGLQHRIHHAVRRRRDAKLKAE